MPTKFGIEEDYAVQESTFPVGLKFFDEQNDPVIPSAASYSLVDDSGNFINSKQNVAITGLAAEKTLVLEGQDLSISAGFTGRFEKRFLVIEATYDSSLGSDLPLNDQLEFYVAKLAKDPV